MLSKRMYHSGRLGFVILVLCVSTILSSTSVAQERGPWRGEYFDNPNLLGQPILERNDSAIDFDWQDGHPDHSLPADGFSVRWTAYLLFEPGTYTFDTYSDSDVRLWIDAQPLIGQWESSAPARYNARVALTAGYHMVRVEYSHSSGNATVRLRWEELGGGTGSQEAAAPSENPESAAELVKVLTTAPAPLMLFDPNVVRRVGGPNESAFEWSRGYKGQLFYDVPEAEPHDGSMMH